MIGSDDQQNIKLNIEDMRIILWMSQYTKQSKIIYIVIRYKIRMAFTRKDGRVTTQVVWSCVKNTHRNDAEEN